MKKKRRVTKLKKNRRPKRAARAATPKRRTAKRSTRAGSYCVVVRDRRGDMSFLESSGSSGAHGRRGRFATAAEARATVKAAMKKNPGIESAKIYFE